MPHDLWTDMSHVDDWLDAPPTDEAERLAKEWLERYRSTWAPGMTVPEMVAFDTAKREWLDAHVLRCTFKGETYRVTGASRLGDVWLTRDHGRKQGYDLREDVLECSDWKRG